MYEKEDMRSPFLSAIENNQFLVIKMLLAKTYTYPGDDKCIPK